MTPLPEDRVLAGVGLKPQHFQAILAERPEIGLFDDVQRLDMVSLRSFLQTL